MIETLYRAGNFKELGKLVDELSDEKQLTNLGEKLESVGMCDFAAKAYEKSGNIKRGVDCCI